MRFGAIIVLSGLILFLGFQIYLFIGRGHDAGKIYSDYKVKLDKAKIDEQKLEDELNYYSNQANILKELKGQFNYKAPGEKLMIIVPKNQTSTNN